MEITFDREGEKKDTYISLKLFEHHKPSLYNEYSPISTIAFFFPFEKENALR